MPTPNTSYTDGLQATTVLSVFCYNNSATYITYDGDPGQESTQKEFTNADMEPLGSDTRTGFRKGTLNLQYTLAVDELPGAANQMHPGFIVSFRGRYYVVGNVKPKVVKNEVIKFSVAVLELQNPFIPGLLSTLGQQLTRSVNVNTANTVNAAAIANRTNSVLTYSVEMWNAPGTAAPAGITINSTTGTLTVNAIAGSYDVRVIATDTLTGYDVNYGQGRYTPTVA